MARLSRKQKALRLTVSVIEVADPDNNFEICDPTARKLRSWQPVAGFTQYKEFIQTARAKGQKHQEIIKSLSDIGVHIKLHQLKYLLDRWGISNRNTTKAQRAYIREVERIREEEGGPDVDYLLRGEQLVRPSQKALIVRNRRAEASESISSSGIRVVKPTQRDDALRSNEVEANGIHLEHGITSPTDVDGECNICHQGNKIKDQLPKFSPGFPESLSANPSSLVLANEQASQDSLGVIVPGLARNFEVVSMQMRTFGLEKLSLADHPEKWSDYYYPHLAQWLSIRKEFAQWVINRANQECRPDECVSQCHDRIMWTSRIPIIPGRYMGHLPLGILESFLHHEPRLDLKNALDELNDWRILENIFLKNFQNILKVVLPAQGERNSRLWFDFRTQIVHFLKMKNLFGPNHYLVIQTMFAIAGVLEQIDTPNAEDLISFSKLLLKKVQSLGLMKNQTLDGPHALSHLARAHIWAGEYQKAEEIYSQYHHLSRELRGCNENQDSMPDSTRTILRYANLYQQRKLAPTHAKAIQEILELHKQKSPHIGHFYKTHGHANMAIEFLMLGDILKHMGRGGVTDVIASYEYAAYHQSKTSFWDSPRLYTTFYRLGKIHMEYGNFESAIPWLQRDVEYRNRVPNLGISSPSQNYLTKIMVLRGPKFYPDIGIVQPDSDSTVESESCLDRVFEDLTTL